MRGTILTHFPGVDQTFCGFDFLKLNMAKHIIHFSYFSTQFPFIYWWFNIGKYLINVEKWIKTGLKHKRCNLRAFHMFGFNESTLKKAWSMPENRSRLFLAKYFILKVFFCQIFFKKGCFSQNKNIFKRSFLTNFP